MSDSRMVGTAHGLSLNEGGRWAALTALWWLEERERGWRHTVRWVFRLWLLGLEFARRGEVDC